MGWTRGRWRVVWWWGLFAVMVALAAVLDRLGQGVLVQMEFAGTAGRVARLFSVRRALDYDDLRLALWIDYAYMAVYATLLWHGCRWARRAFLSPGLAALAGPLAMAGVAAAAFDAIENAAQLIALDGREDLDTWWLVTTTATWPKWVLVAASVTYIGVAALVRVGRGVGARKRPPFTPGVPGPSGGAQPGWLPADAWVPTAGRTGISLSGGGIRSASYALGAMQALREADVLDNARYVTAVSGGSYLAGAWAIAARHRKDGGRGRPPWAAGSPEEAWLRNHTTYLIDGPGRALRAAIRFTAGAAVNLGVIYAAIYLVVRPIGWALSSWAVVPRLRGGATTLVIPPRLWFPAAAVGVVAVVAALVLVNTRGRAQAARVERLAIGAGALALALVCGLVLAPLAAIHVPRALADGFGWLVLDRVTDDREAPERTVNALWLAQSIGLVTVLAAALRAMFRRARGPLVSIATRLVAPLMAALATIYLLAGAAERGPHRNFGIFGFDLVPEWVTWSIVLAGFAVFFLFSDLVTWSLHPYYKARLRSAFALRRTTADNVEPLAIEDEDTLAEYADEPGPQLVVCAAANLSDRGLTPPGRPARPFTFSSTEVGDRELGWIHPRDLVAVLGTRRREDATVSTAVAVSGAAFSPAMGKFGTDRPLALLALVNARLGVWYPNPRWVSALKAGVPGVPWFVRARFDHLFRELFGRYEQSGRLVYVTDGGHVENLGLVELLRRGCTAVWCFDAAGDHIDTFRTIGEAIALARAELGVEIDFDPSPLVPQPDSPRRSPADAVVGSIRYPDGTTGVLYYAKAAVTPDAPWDVQAFADHDPQFPTHSTGDQLFDHEQFEAYRALGYFTASRLAAGVAATPTTRRRQSPKRGRSTSPPSRPSSR
jgi:hypothetical protein